MTLPNALALRRALAARHPFPYVVRRSGERSLGVSPFYVARERAAGPRPRQRLAAAGPASPDPPELALPV